MDILRKQLNNGIRLIHKPIPNMIAHCGLIINCGSRDESPEEHGLAHFIEHMLFKGTKKRKAYHILSSLEDRGGEMNAYTTKEETAVFASFLKDDYNKAFEIISDIVFNSSYPKKEIEKEKEVVLEEINSYKDSPAELIFDDFEEMIYADAPIGKNILGSEDSVMSLSREKIKHFLSENYHTDEMVLCSVGNIPENKLFRLFEKHFGDIKPNYGQKNRSAFKGYKASYNMIEKGTWQNHCIIGNIAYDLKDKRRISMYLLNSILGGQSMNSRLNLSLREKNGFAYNVESSYSPYYDSGVFQIYFGTEEKNRDKSINIVRKELKKLREKELGLIQLHKAKKQIKGNIARSYENHESYMLSMGKRILAFDRLDHITEIYKKIDAITSAELIDIANEIFPENRLSTLIYT